MRGWHLPPPPGPPQALPDIPQSGIFWRKSPWIHLREHVQTSPFQALEQVRTGQITIVTGVMTS